MPSPCVATQVGAGISRYLLEEKLQSLKASADPHDDKQTYTGDTSDGV